MGRGFGRGAKSVAIVTHAQVKGGQKKMPKGLRGSRKSRRRQYSGGEQGELEQSMGMRSTGEGAGGVAASAAVDGAVGKKKGGNQPPRSMAQEIASVQFAHVVNKRQKGFKQLRKQIMQAVKVVRKKHHEKNAKANKRQHVTQKELMAQQYREMSRKNVEKASGNERRAKRDHEEDSSSEDNESTYSGGSE